MAERSAAVLLDLDGTLIDLPVDIQAVRRRLRERFAALGIERPFRPILRDLREAVGELASRTGEDRERLWREECRPLDEAEASAAQRATARAGAVEATTALAGRGVALGIVTDNGRACVLPALAAAGLDARRFGVIVTRDDVRETKPSPEGLLLALRRCVRGAGGPLLAFYAGDSVRDLEAARAAAPGVRGQVELRAVAISGGATPRQELAAGAPDALLDDLRGLLDLTIVSGRFS